MTNTKMKQMYDELNKLKVSSVRNATFTLGLTTTIMGLSQIFRMLYFFSNYSEKVFYFEHHTNQLILSFMFAGLGALLILSIKYRKVSRIAIIGTLSLWSFVFVTSLRELVFGDISIVWILVIPILYQTYYIITRGEF